MKEEEKRDHTEEEIMYAVSVLRKQFTGEREDEYRQTAILCLDIAKQFADVIEIVD